MRQIVYALTANDLLPPLVDRQIHRFVQRMRDDVEDAIWSASFLELDSARPLYEAFERLDDTGRMRLFLSPTGYEAVYRARRSGEDRQLRDLTALIERIGQVPAPVPAETSHESEVPELFRLGGTITVDLGSPDGRRVDPTSPVFMAPWQPFTPQEFVALKDKLSLAFEEIEHHAPSFAHVIRNYTRLIYIRKVEGYPPASEQVDSELGAIRLRNIHLASYPQDQLVDDLIHESVHNFLGTYEYLEAPFIPLGHRPAPDVRPVSPWSMRPIQVLPFLHAAFVYFAMLSYARKRLAAGVDDPAERSRLQARRNRYASGFLMPGRLAETVAELAQVDPRVLQAIDWMQSNVRKSCGPDFGASEPAELARAA